MNGHQPVVIAIHHGGTVRLVVSVILGSLLLAKACAVTVEGIPTLDEVTMVFGVDGGARCHCTRD